jgi:murein DD-endopeptidase MepM/ murein hydrolase activator NlpD
MLRGLTLTFLVVIFTLAKATAGNATYGDVSNAKKGKATTYKARKNIRKRTKKSSSRHGKSRKKMHVAHPPASAFAITSKSYVPSAATPEEMVMNNNFKKNRGKMIWPMENARVTVHFGRYPIPMTNGIIGDNPGITLEGETGAPVHAIFDGEVSQVFDIDGDTAVYIKHGKYYTTYSNLTGINVSPGQKIKAGDILGNVGSNDAGKGEIDFILQDISGTNQDPEKWLANRKQ